MLRKEIFCTAKSIYNIDPNFYIKNGFKYILADLDNTLDSYKSTVASLNLKKLVNKLISLGIELIIISNNNEKRVKTYASSANLKYLSKANKPFAKIINNYLTSKNINKNDCVFIGDQILTDVGAANKLGIKAILTDKITTEDQFVTKINRFLDFLLIKIAKKDGFIDWSKI